MSMTNFINYFVPSHAPLKNNKHLNIPFQSTQLRKGNKKSESQSLTPSSRVHACGTKRGSWGHASILSVMPNTAPDSLLKKSSKNHSTKWWWSSNKLKTKMCFRSSTQRGCLCWPRGCPSECVNDDAEASTISKLQQACGFEYTSKLQRGHSLSVHKTCRTCAKMSVLIWVLLVSCWWHKPSA